MAYNQPGAYVFAGRCTVINVPGTSVTVDMCVVSVDVRENGYMQFNIAWTAHVAGTGQDWAQKGSDVGNRNMNVTDNLGNRYDHVELGGVAGENVILRDNETGYGWYLFPAAYPGATVFTFHDDDQHVAVGDIVLSR